MEQHLVKIKSIKHITPDVLQIVTEKPDNYTFAPGQVTEIAINKLDWKDKKRPFTFTSLPVDDFLQFTIKTYPLHKGVTNALLRVEEGDELILHDVFGAIAYQGEGLFIAGGAGVTPFISIFRHLQLKKEIRGNKLIFANKTKDDIILASEFEELLGENFINILSNERTDEYACGQIDEDFLLDYVNDSTKNIYVCGPPPMMNAIDKQLAHLKIDEKQIIKEVF